MKIWYNGEPPNFLPKLGFRDGTDNCWRYHQEAAKVKIMKKLPIKQAIFLIEHTIPLTVRGKVVRHFMATRKGDLEVFGLIYNDSRFFYFIYNGIVGIASNLIMLRKVAWDMGL